MLVFREGAEPVDPAEVHRASPVADLHAHPGLTAYWLKRDLARQHRPPSHGYNPLRQQLDLPRMLQGGLRVLTACVYAPTVAPFPRPFKGALGAMRFVEDLCAREAGKVVMAGRGQVRAILASGRLAVIHAAEGGHHIERSLEKLEQLAARGLRYLTLTHFVHNGLAQPARLGPFTVLRGPPGLTELGRSVVKKCEELGVLVDVSHCSDRSFADVAALATRPLLATHTGFRRFHDVERNLSDEQLRTIGRSGGVAGVITWSWLLRRRGFVADVEDLGDAVVHGALVAGPEHIGIGTDFDGYVWSARRIREARHYPALSEALSRRGFTAAELRGILGGNYLRVLGEL
ncbi:MAG TPA: membrane dipeptidase [Myxococcales bacterium]|nr:membrane dipeptidase [Myxococcales bacterium]